MTGRETVLQRSWRRAWNAIGAIDTNDALRQRLLDA